MDTLIAPLISALKENHASVNDAEVTRAFEVARDAHAGQLRKSGEPYITHPVAVAEILANLGLNPATIIAALLHDTVEDTQYSSTQLRHDFGDEIANLVDGVTKLDKLSYGPTAEAETVRKMVIAMSRDIRVLVIKLADRLHNARTWKYVSEESAARKARETLDIYAPLAHRLGMNAMKWELEDLSFEVLEPKKFEEISRLVGRSLRAVVNMKELGENTIVIDCDVLQADGGTRTAAITGAYVALADAISWAKAQGHIKATANPLSDSVAAVSVGIIDGVPMLDLCYEEDVRAGTDMNVVVAGDGRFIEVQGTAEGAPFDRALLDQLLDLAVEGCATLTKLQKEVLSK